MNFQQIANEWYQTHIHGNPTSDNIQMLSGYDPYGDIIEQTSVKPGQFFSESGNDLILIADDEYGYCVFIEYDTGNIKYLGHYCQWLPCKNIEIIYH